MSKKKIPGDQQSNERLHPASLVLFGEYAGAIALKGLCVVPCGGEDGKRPLIVGWSRPRRRRSHHQLVGLLSRFQWANVGIACGPSNLVIVDIDAGDLLGQMLERFGVTPLIVRTPSGGFHLYYRAGPTPLRCKNLRAMAKSW